MILPETKIWQAASKDADRAILTAVHYDAKRKRLVAADGFMLAAVPVCAHEDENMSANIPAEVIKQAAKLAKRRADEPALAIGDGTATPFVANTDRWGEPVPLVDGQYPDYNQVIPRAERYKFAVALDAKRLLQLAEALIDNGGQGVRLYLSEDGNSNSPIVVKPIPIGYSDSGAIGVLMPMFSQVDAAGTARPW